MYGSREEWDALTAEDQSEQWESFHEMDASGTADTLYFYEVVMAEHLIDYVGH